VKNELKNSRMHLMDKIRTRFAPSPTGNLHIGGLRTALYAYGLSKHSGGDFVLRIEDTDQKREVPGSTEKIKELLNMFGLTWDEYAVQSQRAKEGIYKNVAEKLVADEHAFYCQCKAKNAKVEGFSKELRDPCRDLGLKEGAIKLRVPDGEKIGFTDYVLGKEVIWDTDSVGDTTLLKTDNFPTYHLAVVVDDSEMNITHVLRGHDWMPSTPIHLLVYKYLGLSVPKIGHLTDILDPEGGKLSKRKGSVSCEGMMEEGYLPEALLNFVMLLGWAPKDNREMFSLKDFVEAFDPKGFQKSNPILNREKLDWFNGQYIRNLDDSKLSELLLKYSDHKDKEMIDKITPLIKDRITKLTDINSFAGFFFERKSPDTNLFTDGYKEQLLGALKTIKEIGNWNKEELDTKLMAVVTEKGYKTGDFFMNLRIAITGSKFTPPINDSILILGQKEVTERIRNYI
jgi:glutamyl-tRNA synthetase